MLKESTIMERWGQENSDVTVSICVISYNHEAFIEETLNSLVSQVTDFPFEIVVDDDASTDNTAAIIQKFKDQYPHIFRINFRDTNVGVVRNKTASLKRAKGEYITICEGDDAWTDTNKLQYQVMKMQDCSACDISFHPVYLTYDETLPTAFIENYIEKSQNILSQVDGEYLFSYFGSESNIFSTEEVISKGGGFMATSSLMLKREVIDTYADFIEEAVVKVDGKFIDYYLQILSAARGGALFLPKAMSTYRLHNSGVWTSMLIREDASALNAAESGIVSVLSELDTMLEGKYHDTFTETMTALLEKIIAREQSAIEERVEVVEAYSQFLPLEKQLDIQKTLTAKLLNITSDPANIRLNDTQIDTLRDVALSLEHLNMQYAYTLLEIAHMARPNGTYIAEKLKEFEVSLSSEFCPIFKSWL